MITPSVYPIDIPDNCVLYADMQESGVTRVTDHSGFANHGTLTGTTSGYAPIGYTRELDGDDLINFGNGASLQAWTTFSIEMLTYIPDGAAALRILAAKSESGTGTGTGFYIYRESSIAAKQVMAVYNGAGDKVTLQSVADEFSIPGWHHTIWTVDGANINLYHNGVYKKQAACVGHSPANSNNLVIGSFAHSPSYYFIGGMRIFLAYNTALDAYTIKRRYNACAQLAGLRVI